MQAIQTLAEIYQTPFYCNYIDTAKDIKKQKNFLACKLVEICKQENPLKYSIELYKSMRENNQEMNTVIFKIPNEIVIIDTDDQVSESRIRNLFFDDVLDPIATPSISRALGVNMSKGYHYYFRSDEKFKLNGQKEQYKGGDIGDMDILGAGGPTSGFIIEHIDSVLPIKSELVLDNETYNKITLKKNDPIYKNNEITAESESEFFEELEDKFKAVDIWRKWCELMPNENVTREEWLTIAKFFNKYFTNDGFDIFTIWSKKWYMYNSRDDLTMWKSIKQNSGVSVGSMIYLLKKYAPESYKIWINQVNNVDEKSYYISNKVLTGSIYELAEVLHKDIMKYAIYCNDEWYIYNDKVKIWKSGKDKPITIVSQTIKKWYDWNIYKISEKLFYEGDNTNLEETRNIFLSQKKKLDTPSACSQFVEHLKTLNRDEKFKDKLDNLKGKIAYQNGIYDIETDTFREGIFYEDFLTFYLPFDYKKSNIEDKERAKDILMKINSMESWKYEYYIKSLGYSLTGYSDREQVAFFCIGMAAGNGKSTIFEALTAKMPGYVNKMKSDAFVLDNSKRHKYFNSIDKNRIIWINEVAKGDQDIDFIKDFSDGKKFKNEVLYGTEKDIKVNGKLFFVSNGEPKFVSDEGIKRRYRYIEFISKFFDNENDYEAYHNKDIKRHFMKDQSVGVFLESDEGITALLEILYEGARLYFKDGLKTPALYDELKKEAIRANDIYDEFITCYFKEEEGKSIFKGELEGLWNLSGCSGKFNLDQCVQGLKAKGYVYDCNKQKKISGKLKKGCFINIKFVDNDDE